MKRAPSIPMVVSLLLTFVALALGGARPALAQTPPANDSIDNPVRFTALPFTATQDTSGATLDPNDVNLSCFPESSTVWYAFTPTTDVSVHLDTAGSDYDTTLNVLTSTGMGAASSLSVVQCNDSADFGSAQTAAADFQARAGTTYLIMVGAHGPGGTLVLTATVFPISVQIDPHVTFDPTTQIATVTTTVTCDVPVTVIVVATSVRLVTAGTIGPSATGVDRPFVVCDSTHPLSLTQGILVLSPDGKRRGGPAIVPSTIVMNIGSGLFNLAAQTPVILSGH